MKERKRVEAFCRVFGLKAGAVKLFLIMNSQETLESLSRKTGLALPSLSRYLNGLAKAGLVRKIPKCCIGKRGRYFVYEKASKKELERLARERAEELVGEVVRTR